MHDSKWFVSGKMLYISALVSFSLREENKLFPNASFEVRIEAFPEPVIQSASSDLWDKEQELHLSFIQIKEKVAAHRAKIST